MDFTTMTLAEIAAFVVDHQQEMGAHGITAEEVTAKVSTGRACLETRPFGFALVELTTASDGKAIPHLWLLYVAPESRGRALGRRFVRELLAKHAADYHMSLWCEGPQRRAFFGRLGFRVEVRDGEMRRMTTNDTRR